MQIWTKILCYVTFSKEIKTGRQDWPLLSEVAGGVALSPIASPLGHFFDASNLSERTQ